MKSRVKKAKVGSLAVTPTELNPIQSYMAGANTYQYDANGNMTNRPNQTMTYDYDNRPIAINSTTFIYDHAGQKIKKNNTI